MTDYNKQYKKKEVTRKRYETYIVNSEPGLNLRDVPDGDILTVLPNNTRVSFNGGVKMAGDVTWLLVKAGSTEGYVMERYLKRT